MKNILLPTDYSDQANNAFLYALSLANHLHVDLIVLYTYTPPILSAVHAGQPDLLSNVYIEIEQSRKDFSIRKNKELIKLAEEKQLNTSNITFIFENGSVLSSVKKLIDEFEISLVAMGIFGSTGMHTDYMGSNTVSVIKHIKLPVLAIPKEAKFTTIKNIAFTTLFKEKDLIPLKQIVEISTIVNAQVYCINVMNNTQDPSDALLQSDNWSKEFKNVKDLHFVLLEKTVSVEDTVNHFIKDNAIDVLAIVRRNRNFFDRLMNSSISNKLTFHAEIPIFVFHEVD